MQPISSEQHLGAIEPPVASISPTAREVQRSETTRVGVYLCEVCRTTFEYASVEDELVCPKCHNKEADLLTSIYIEDDPQSSELMTEDQFSAGD